MQREVPGEERRIAFNIYMNKVSSLIRLALGFIALGSISGQAQTWTYTYTGNDFTSASGSYATSDQVTGFLTFSAPLGDSYTGSPSATLLSFHFSDGVGPQNISGGPGAPALDALTLGTDSSGAIVSWNVELLLFLPPLGAETKQIQTENDSANVLDMGNLEEVTGIVRQSRQVGGNRHARAISQSFICLIRGPDFCLPAAQAT
jgi:hypothetical protein